MKHFRSNRHRYISTSMTAAALMLVLLLFAACGSKEAAPAAPAAPASAETSSEASGGQGRDISIGTETEAVADEAAKDADANAAAEKDADAAAEADANAAAAEDRAPAEPEKAAEAESDAAEGEAAKGAASADEFTEGAPAYANDIPTFTINQLGYYEFDEESEDYRQLSEVAYDCIYLTDEAARKFPKLDDAFNALAKEREERFTETSKELTNEMKDLLEQGMPYYGKLYQYSEARVHRADAGIFSWVFESSMYYGGAHGDYGYGGYTYDAQTGEELHLKDVVTDLPSMADRVIDFLRANYDEEIFFDSMEDTVRGYFEEEAKEGGEGRISWTLEPDSITFWFSPYEIAPYASGVQCARIMFAEAPELFADRATASAQENYAIEMPYYTPVWADLGGDGKMDQIQIWGDLNENSEYTNIHVVINGKDTVAKDTWCYSITPVLVHAYDHDALLADTKTDNDYRVMYTFDLQDDGAVYFGSDNAAFTAEVPMRFGKYPDGGWRAIPANVNSFKLSTRYDMLSTLTATRTYQIGAQDILIPIDEYYDLKGNDISITTKVDLHLDIVDEETGELLEEGALVKKGLELFFFRTDNETWTDMKDHAGNVYRVVLETGENPWYREVDGHSLNAAFDNVMFAG